MRKDTVRRVRSLLRWGYDSPVLMLCVAVAGWSGNFIVGRLVHDSMPAVGLAFFRWLTAFAVLLPFGVSRLRQDLPVLRRHWPTVLTLAVAGVTAYNTLIYTGLQTTTAINALLLQSVMPLLIIVFAFVLFQERPSTVQLAGLALSLVGVWVVITEGHPFSTGRLTLGAGDVWIVLAVVSYSFYTALLRRRPQVHPLSLLIATFGLGSAVLVPFVVAETLTGEGVSVTPGSAAAVAYVALIPSILSYFCYNRGVELIGGARAGQYLHLMPVFGAALAFVILGERIRDFHMAGAAAIALGIIAATVRPHAAPAHATPSKSSGIRIQ